MAILLERSATASSGASPNPSTPLVVTVTINAGETGVLVFTSTGTGTLSAVSTVTGGGTWSQRSVQAYGQSKTEIWSTPAAGATSTASVTIAHTAAAGSTAVAIVGAYSSVVALGRTATSTASGGTTANPGALPVANRQLPDFATYTGGSLAAGQSYLDPITGVRVWKLTDATYPVANTEGKHDYSSGAVQASRAWGTGGTHHSILVQSGYIIDLERGVGLSGARTFPAPGPNTDLCFTFSQLVGQERIGYFVGGTSLYKIDTATMTLDNTGFFPKSFSSLTASSLIWLHQDKNDEWFVVMPVDASRIILWNRLTDETKTIVVPNLNEPHLDKEGRYVMACTNDEPLSWRMWDTQTNTLSAGISKEGHPDFLRSRIISTDPNDSLGPQWMYTPATSTQESVLTGSQMSPDLQHHAGQWVQSDASLPGADLRKQWSLWSGYNDGIANDPTWALVSGQIYSTTPTVLNYDNRQSVVGVQSVRQWATGSTTTVARQLTKVASQAALVEGSFFWDATPNKLYVWAQGGGSPTGRVQIRYPAWVHDGIGFMRIDGSEVRFLAHHYSINPTYWDCPRATLSADGRLVLFGTNQNGSRTDAYAVEVPSSGGTATVSVTVTTQDVNNVVVAGFAGNIDGTTTAASGTTLRQEVHAATATTAAIDSVFADRGSATAAATTVGISAGAMDWAVVALELRSTVPASSGWVYSTVNGDL